LLDGEPQATSSVTMVALPRTFSGSIRSASARPSILTSRRGGVNSRDGQIATEACPFRHFARRAGAATVEREKEMHHLRREER
jgi:hypothetical protein